MFTRQRESSTSVDRTRVAKLGALTLLLILVISFTAAHAQIPVLFSDPVDGGTFLGRLTITFTQPMQDPIAMEFTGTGGVSFTSAWQVAFPGVPNLILECTPNGTLPPGSVVTWTVNPNGTGFTTITGDVLPTTSGTFVVPGGGGGGGDVTAEVPECPANAVSLPFSKTMSICGQDALPWRHAAVIPALNGSGYILSGFADSETESRIYQGLLDAQGILQSKAMTVDGQTELMWTTDPNLVLAHRLNEMGDAVTVGVYNMTMDLQPVYEKTLTLSTPQADVAVMPVSADRVAIVQDLSTQIEVVVLAANGDVDWANTYSSSAFGVDSAGGGFPGLGGEQVVALWGVAEGFFMSVSKFEQTLVGFDFTTQSSMILIRLTDSGAVQWAKTYTGLNTFSPPTITSTLDGSLFLEALDTNADSEIVKLSSILVQLNTDGSPRWGKRFPDVTLAGATPLPAGPIFTSGNTTDVSGLNTDSIFITLDDNGNLLNQVQVSAGSSSLGFAVAGEDRLWYTLALGDDVTPGIQPTHTTVIGSSNLTFDTWQWQAYTRKVSSAFLLPAADGPDLVLSAFRHDTNTLDLIALDNDLTTDAPCALFTTTDVQVTPASLVSTNISLQTATVPVNSNSITPLFAPGSIALQTFNCLEKPICE